MKPPPKRKSPKNPDPAPPAPGATTAQASGQGSTAFGRDVINSTINNIFQQAAHYKPSPLHQLPSLTESFTGRSEEIDQLSSGILSRAREGRPVAIVCSIHGQGGIGKTELAVAVGYALVPDSPEAQILGVAYAELGKVRKAIEFFEQHQIIVREIGDRRGEGNDLVNLGNAYANLGETQKAARALWMLNHREQAIARAEAALAIYEAIESPHAAMVRPELAEWKKAEAKA